MAITDIQSSQQMQSEYRIYTDLKALLATRHRAHELKLFSRQPARSMLFGETRSRFRGRGMEFEEVRRYQPGDDIRTIDWRVSARTGKPHTKLFCEERERPVHILVDQRSSMFFGSTRAFKSVIAAETAAIFAWAALAGSDRIGGQIIADNQERDIRARRNKQAVLKFIHDLHHLNGQLPGNQPTTRRLAQMLDECRRLTRPGTAIFVISDFHDMDEDAERALATLGRNTDITLVQVYDPVERQLPNVSELAISDGRKRASIDMNREIIASYQQQLQIRESLLKKAVRGARAASMEISTADSPLAFLQRRYGK